MRLALGLAAAAVLVASSALAQAPAPALGQFDGRVIAVWDDPAGRKMRLMEDFAYVDASGTTWLAPKGSLIDGASIPQVFWSFIGGPFEGKYREASVVHDVACQTKQRSWRTTHRMFYYASLLGGVDPVLAKSMYAAVYHFGPRWPGLEAVMPPQTMSTSADFLRLKEYIRTNPGPSLPAIESITAEQLEQSVPQRPAPR